MIGIFCKALWLPSTLPLYDVIVPNVQLIEQRASVKLSAFRGYHTYVALLVIGNHLLNFGGGIIFLEGKAHLYFSFKAFYLALGRHQQSFAAFIKRYVPCFG
jgi:hypothetical protein